MYDLFNIGKLLKSRLFVSVIVSLVTALPVCAQQIFSNQQKFAVEEGLPQNFVSGITQDEDGFIWLSTSDGLCRYDGRGFRIFKHNNKDSGSLYSSTIHYLYEAPGNTITLLYGGSAADDMDMRSFKVSRNPVRTVMESTPEAIWNLAFVKSTTDNWLFLLKTHKGIGWYNKKSGRTFFASKANKLLQQDTIAALTESTDGKLYLVSSDGVQVSDTAKKKFIFHRFTTTLPQVPNFRDPVSLLDYSSVIVLPQNRIALYITDTIVLLDVNKKSVTRIPVPVQSNPAFNNAHRQLRIDAQGRLYFANKGRIFRLEANNELKLLWQNNELPHIRITTCFIDRSDVLWVSVSAHGVTKVDLKALPFYSYTYKEGSNFLADIMEQAGVNRTAIPAFWLGNQAPYYLRQSHNRNGALFFTYNSGKNKAVFQLHQTAGLTTFPHTPDKSLYSAIAVAPDNSIWIYNYNTTQWVYWKSPDAVPSNKSIRVQDRLTFEPADATFVNGSLWMSTYAHGLVQYSIGDSLTARFYTVATNKNLPKDLTEICIDPADKQQFWLGSRGGGLVLWHTVKGLQRVFTTDDGLPNNTIYCILADKAGNIWCSTNKGIFCFDPVRKVVVNAFEKTDGLPGNEFNRAHKFLFADGRMAFGGIDGYVIFNPADFTGKRSVKEVPLFFTSIQVNNEVQETGLPGSYVNEPLAALQKILLPYNKNNLRFEFAALRFNQPQKIKYRYRLKGVDEKWIDNNNSNTASYSTLQPGTYTLYINATDETGQWSSVVKELVIIIRPPFWATWWAYLFYVLLLFLLIRGYFKFREKQIKTQQTLAAEKREALRLKELDEIKNRFFSNITHEFRTPLTLIISPLEKLLKENNLPSPAQQTVQTAYRNSQQLLRLINEFLDFSKLDDGQLKVHLSAGDLQLFIKNYVESFAVAAEEKNITLQFTAHAVEGLYLFDREKLEKIIGNLLSNALKFTPVNGNVRVSLAAEKKMLVLEVSDNGPGIPANQQHKIFDRFYQVDDSAVRVHGGTGIGLALVKELTELLNGSITLQSTEGSGSTFRICIPAQKADEQVQQKTNDAVALQTNIQTDTAAEQPLLLIAEDNDELRAFLVQHMQQHYRVLEAADGLQAWELTLQELPDLIISDVMMPGMDGFDFCRNCKADQRTAHIGFILLTSKAAQEAKLKGLVQGADDYITKPFQSEELELRIANLLQLQQKQRNYLKAQVLSNEPAQQKQAVEHPFLQQLYKEMDAKLDDAELGVDYLCKAMAMSRSTLNRKLKALLDITTNDLIRRYRLQKAAALLTEGNDITSVVYRVGFSSPSYFSQCFREQYGVTPSEYITKQKTHSA